MTLALESRFEPFSEGRGFITPERVEEMEKMADRHGICLAPLYNGGWANRHPAELRGGRDKAVGVKSEHQVELSNLLFGMSWEDPSSDRRALNIKPGDTVMTISSGGCNTLTLLLDNPAKIYAVDINASQSYLLELKIAAVRHLKHEELLAFLGLAPSESRLRVFESLAGDLTTQALAYWTRNADAVQQGVVHTGRYESFIGKFIRFLGVVQGKSRIENFFRCASIEDQGAYFDNGLEHISMAPAFQAGLQQADARQARPDSGLLQI